MGASPILNGASPPPVDFGGTMYLTLPAWLLVSAAIVCIGYVLVARLS